MLRNSIIDFLEDERGGYTMWSLLWFVLYLGIGGVAVDVTDVYRNQSLLQATADAACLAGVMSLPDEGDAENKAMYYAARNLDPQVYGWVLKTTDVRFGTWDNAARRFYEGTSGSNAIYVTTRRSDENSNPVAMNVLRIATLLGVPSPRWNVAAEAVCERYHPACAGGGFLAGEKVFWRSNNDYFRKFCIHGMIKGVAGRNGNTYEPDVRITWGPDAEADFPPPALSKEDLDNALAGTDTLWPTEAYAVGEYIDTLKSLGVGSGPGETGVDYSDFSSNPDYEKYQSWEFLYQGVGDLRQKPAKKTTLPKNLADIEEYTIYDIDCKGKKIDLGESAEMHNVALIANCPVHAAASFSGGNVILASTYAGPNAAVNLAAKAGLGNPDFCDPGDGGGLEVLTPGSIHVSAQGEFHGLRMISGQDVKMTSQNAAGWGVGVIAAGNIDASANNEFGLCPTKQLPGPVEWRYRLVQ